MSYLTSPLDEPSLVRCLFSPIDNSSTQPGRLVMTPLRQQMIAALQLSGKSERTQQSSVREVRLLAQFYHTSPDRISEQELQHYFLHRKNNEASPQQAAGYQTEGHCRGDTTVSPPSSLCKVTPEQAPRNLLIEGALAIL